MVCRFVVFKLDMERILNTNLHFDSVVDLRRNADLLDGKVRLFTYIPGTQSRTCISDSPAVGLDNSYPHKVVQTNVHTTVRFVLDTHERKLPFVLLALVHQA